MVAIQIKPHRRDITREKVERQKLVEKLRKKRYNKSDKKAMAKLLLEAKSILGLY